MNKKGIVFFLLICLSLTFGLYAQSTTIDFESGDSGTAWAWTVAENGTNPAITFPVNPDNSGINTSATVAQFTAESGGNPWALCYTDDIDLFEFDATNSTVSIMVYKPVISPVAIKFEGGSTPVEIQIANTLVNQWEQIDFDFSGSIGNSYSRLVIIPDFAARAQDNVLYFDNIVIPEENTTPPPPPAEPEIAAPTPDENETDVISIFSDEYTDLAGTDFNPPWGQSTVVTTEVIDTNDMLKYGTFNYQGTQLLGAHDLSSMTHVHIDMWTEDATVVLFSPISATTGEHLVSLTPIATETWNSYDIPLTDFVGLSFIDIHQLKFDGQSGVSPSTIYLDNIYFYSAPILSSDATLNDLLIDGTTVSGFDTNTLTYNVELPEGTTVVPTVTATTTDVNASHVVNDAISLPGTTEVVVTAEDGTTMITYSVVFTVAQPTVLDTPAPTPDELQENVVSVYSDSYTDIAGTNFDPFWGQSTQVSFEDIVGNNVMKYDTFNYQGTELPVQNLSTMEYIHIDLWTPDATVILFSPISQTTGEHLVSLTPINIGSWNSYDIPLSDFTGVAMFDIFQLKFDGQAGVNPSTIYLDNIYFWKTPTVAGTDATLADLQIDGSTVSGFSPTTLIYDVLLDWDTTAVPTVTATTADPLASHTVNDAASLPGTTQVVVTAQNGTDTETYSINFTVDDPPATVTNPAPEPTDAADDVISIYSDSYTDIAGTNFNPWWGQSTQVSFEDVAGNNMMKYDTFNYQGTQLNGNQDLSLMEYIHIDMWTEDATVVLFSPISASTGESLVSLTPITPMAWNSFDIPLSDFTGVSMSDIHQLKFDGQAGVTPSTIYLDNIYFWKTPAAAGTDATLADLRVGGTSIDGFSSIILTYEYELSSGSQRVPTITAITNDPNASYVVNNPASVPGASTIVVTADDGITELTYTINFTVADPAPEAPAPTPTADATNVISMYSDAYQDVTVDTWSAPWDLADVEDELVGADNVKLYTNLVFAGIEFTSQTIDATSLTHFHMDIWTPDDTSAPSEFKVKLVDFGADGSWGGGDDVEHELVFGETTMNTEMWVSLDIPLTDFINLTTTGHLAQLIISGTPNTVYIDNVYFYNDNPLSLGIPQGVTVSVTGTDVTVAWDEVTGASSYIVYESETPDGDFTPVTGGNYNGTSWTGSAGTSRKFYYVKASDTPVR